MDYNIKRIYEQYQQTGHDSATRQGWSSAATQQANFKAVLDALQTDELCPCNWQKGDETLKAA